jgi:hypothetical protein
MAVHSLKRVQELELKLAAMQELERKQGLKLATVLAEQVASKRAQEAASKELPHRSKGKAPPNAHSKRKQTAPDPDESDQGSESSSTMWQVSKPVRCVDGHPVLGVFTCPIRIFSVLNSSFR